MYTKALRKTYMNTYACVKNLLASNNFAFHL